MEYNVYDFDGTIYDGDSTLDFYIFCMMRNPVVLLDLPKTILFFLKFKFGKCTRKDFKTQFYTFLIRIKNIDAQIEGFWNLKLKNIKNWYFEKHQDNDIIISASPEFLLLPVCEKIKIKNLIASKVHSTTGEMLGENCRGKEKVTRFMQQYSNCVINDFYSDSKSDEPIAQLAKKAFLVKGDKITDWN